MVLLMEPPIPPLRLTPTPSRRFVMAGAVVSVCVEDFFTCHRQRERERPRDGIEARWRRPRCTNPLDGFSSFFFDFFRSAQCRVVSCRGKQRHRSRRDSRFHARRMGRLDKTRQDKTRQDKTRQDKTRAGSVVSGLSSHFVSSRLLSRSFWLSTVFYTAPFYP